MNNRMMKKRRPFKSARHDQRLQLVEQPTRFDNALGQFGRQAVGVRLKRLAGGRLHFPGGLFPFVEQGTRFLLDDLQVLQALGQPRPALALFLLGVVLGPFEDRADGPARFLVRRRRLLFLLLFPLQNSPAGDDELAARAILLDLEGGLDADPTLFDLALVLLLFARRRRLMASRPSVKSFSIESTCSW